MGGALMSFLPVSNRNGCLAGIYLVNAIVAPLPVLYAVRYPIESRPSCCRALS